MGCWNETCLISNLAIRYNSPVVAFLTAHEDISEMGRNYSGYCYSTDPACPISLPVKAKYNDYGFIEKYDEKDLPARHIRRLFGKSLDDLCEELHDGKLIIKNGIKGHAGVGMVMINEHIYNTAINKISYVDKNKVKAEIIKDIELKLSIEKMSADDKLKTIFGTLDITRAGSIAQYGSDRVFLNSILEMAIEDIKKSPKKKDKILNSYAEQMADRVAVASAMSNLRKTWLPPCGKGSQDDNAKGHMILASAIREAALLDREPEELYYMFLSNDR